ncbi:class I SAM-dependent methyltransferase [Okeania sp. SIO1F9]|uniref:class I SAM-dependent methyltransferase n=1 Tax=Okeania sp. SIO1F9 TaxID=2607813 RepID=UPI00144F5F27|nr:class I SAM-dependent methyltransferase [Okeania sp. SIO1F9]NET78584.1 methyltransferase domain-containing protein [Okeania sp. SIO1F9]
MENSKNEQQKKVASYWFDIVKKNQKSQHLRLRWWQSPYIVRYINKKITGLTLDGLSQGITQRPKEMAGDRYPFSCGVSVGCGNGQKEITLVCQGLVSSFQLYEISEVRIEQGRRLAARFGVENKVTFIQGDALEVITEKEVFDFVHWNNSLHHMLDVEVAIKWSYEVLQKGGMFYMDDYVGPNRMQWSDKMLEVASQVRSILPEKYLANPRNPSQLLPKTLTRNSIERMIQIDPSEAADSERIIDSIKKSFPQAEITITGGVVYHLALSDILHNFDESKDKYLLDFLMLIDDLCSELGETHYATAIAIK